MSKIRLTFDKGTIVAEHVPEELQAALKALRWDPRTQVHRAPAQHYRDIALYLHRAGVDWQDDARQFSPVQFQLIKPITPRPFQKAAAEAWLKAEKTGVVSLPTGSGKTILAVLLIVETQRPTLVHVPTIDLMHQWYDVLKSYLGTEIGIWGGGYNETHPVTVTTYDSALLHVTSKGNRFGLNVFDECHHLPGDQYQYAAISNIAPFRLGLTATPERSDGKEKRLYKLVGPLCYQSRIDELEGSTLAPYEVITHELSLTDEEQKAYDEARQIYLDYLKSENIIMGAPGGWNRFLWKTSRTPEGRQVFKAYLHQKQLSLAASAKLEKIWHLLDAHRGDRIIIFTQDNEMAYRIGRRFFLPVLTHHTKVKEREHFLKSFRSGEYPVLVTSKVLNEGVDVPEANIAVVVSGSGSVREHVQRLGRILRARPGKKAILYELVAKGTGEHFINKRRRKHSAYQRPGSS